MGTARDDSTGAEVNTANTRKNGHNIGEIQARIWASVKDMPGMPLKPRNLE
jgi:hypothetical protein